MGYFTSALQLCHRVYNKRDGQVEQSPKKKRVDSSDKQIEVCSAKVDEGGRLLRSYVFINRT